MKSKPTFEIETITPSVATKYLEQNRKNRPIARGTVEFYADAIRAGHWLFNGEAIKFDCNGDLVDGQHRLHAIAKAGKAIQTLVIRGLDPQAFKTIDTGRQRNGGDVLALRGILYSGKMSSAYRLLYRLVIGKSAQKRRISNTQLLQLVDEHPDMIELGYEAMRAPITNDFYAGQHQIYFFYLAQSIAPPLARRFLAELRNPEGNCPNAEALHDRLVTTSKEVVRPATGVRWFWLLQAWNATVAGKPVERFSRSPELTEFNPAPRIGKARVKAAA